jgi:hypothetical protein
MGKGRLNRSSGKSGGLRYSNCNGCPQNMQASSLPSILVTFLQAGHSTCGADVDTIPDIMYNTVPIIIMKKLMINSTRKSIWKVPAKPVLRKYRKNPIPTNMNAIDIPMFQFAHVRIRLILLRRSVLFIFIPPIPTV